MKESRAHTKSRVFIEEHGEIAAELLSHFSTIDEAKKAMEENYAGCHESVADFAEELTTDTTEIPESLAFYIDYKKWGVIWSWVAITSPLRRDTAKFIYSGTTNRNSPCFGAGA